MKVNEVIDLYDNVDIKFSIRPLIGSEKMLLIEGDRVSLEFLGKLILAHAQNKEVEGCSFQISPSGAGNAYFAADSVMGLYLHTLPCEFEGQEHHRL
jgi:hypothetical protein